MFSVGSSSAVSYSSCFLRTNLRVLSLTKDVKYDMGFSHYEILGPIGL